MGLVQTESGLSAADLAAVLDNNGRGNAWGGDGSMWLLVLFLFAMANGGWGNGFGFGGGIGAAPYLAAANTNNDVQRGFDQLNVMNGINGLTSAVSSGFANAEVSRCNQQTNILQTLANNQMGLYQTLNANQNQTDNGFASLGTQLQQCCCENRLATANLQSVIQTENCADRYEAANNTRDILANATANTQAILDKLCQLEMDGIRQNYENRIATLNAQNQQLATDNNALRLAQSQTAQTAQLLADNAAQTAALEHYLNPTPIPAYTVPAPFQYGNCGCNCGN